MTRLQIALATVMVAATVTLPAAQVVAPPEAPAPASVDPFPPRGAGDGVDVFGSSSRGALRIGQDYTLAAGDRVREVVVIFGNAMIAGEVEQEVIVVFGAVRLAATAVVGGDFVAIGSNVSAAPGAIARRDMVVVGGTFDPPPGFMPGGEHVVIGGGLLGGWIEGLVPYLTRGLLWGRLIVPGLPWMWGTVALFLLLYLGVNLLFHRPVRACAETLTVKPLTAFGAGLLVMLLVAPVCLLLAVSVIGLAVVPFVLLALFGGWIVGKVAVARWIGMSVFTENEPDSRAHAARSVVVGFLLISLAYMLPVLGIVTWAITGVLGLGSAFLTFLTAYRREHPRPAPMAPDTPGVPPPPVPIPYAPPASFVPPAPEPDASSSSSSSAPSPGGLMPPPVMAYAAAGDAGGTAAAAAASFAASPSVLISMPRALFRDRLAAFVLDMFMLVAFVNIIDVDRDGMFVPIALAYHVGLWSWKQATLGGMICQIRVVRTDGAPLSFADALIRGLAAIVSLAVFFIGALWMLRDPESQTWHDKVAGTYVVKVPRGYPV